MVDVILIQPKIGVWDEMRSSASLPLSLLYTSTLIKEEFEIELIDQRVDKNWKNRLIKLLKTKPLCVGITSLIGDQILKSICISKIVKENSNIPVVWGGVHPSLIPEITIKNPYIDIVVIGEGEKTFHDLLIHLRDSLPLSEVKGIIFKTEDKSGKTKIIENKKRKLIDLENLPPLPYDLLDITKYLPKYQNIPTVYIMSSRGCVHNCGYCYNQYFNRKKWRSITPEKVIEKIRFLHNKFDIKAFYFVDDNFLVDVNRGLKIASLIRDLPFKISWQIQGITANSFLKLSFADLKLLEQSGLKRVSIGAETGSNRILKEINKCSTIAQVIKLNKILSKYNIIVYYSFICGFPGERLTDLKKTIALAFHIIRDNPNARTSPFYIYSPFPKTPFYEKAVDMGFKPPQKLQGWARFDHNRLNLNLFSKKYQKILRGVNFVSLFIDKKFNEYTIPTILRIMTSLYRPIARFRIKHLIFSFLLERWALNLLLRALGTRL